MEEGRALLHALAFGADVEQAPFEHVLLALLERLALPHALDAIREDVGGLGAPLVIGAAGGHVAVPLDDELVVRRRTIGVLVERGVLRRTPRTPRARVGSAVRAKRGRAGTAPLWEGVQQSRRERSSGTLRVRRRPPPPAPLGRPR